ncbi:hypothetical protein K439DRAFT_1167305 [Ramaria rubella]|nr:hypothetical protein K439DRAFT_1167305 [Ramaria rubella]
MSQSSLTRSDAFYFEDGNLVVIVEEVAFRLHRGLLARHSPVFRDMSALPNSSTGLGDGFFDGCPVVRLQDRVTDVVELLRCLYDHFDMDGSDSEKITSVLRLSTKYLMDNLRALALNSLAKRYPTTLTEWDRGDHGFSRDDCADIIKVAYELDAHVLLPAAYYQLCSIETEKVFALGLSSPVLHNYVLGKEKISLSLPRFIEEELFYFDVTPIPGCFRGKGCTVQLSALYKHALHIIQQPDAYHTPTPLEAIDSLYTSSNVKNICMACQDHVEEQVFQARSRIWKSLPDTFRLESWQELRKDRQ